MFIAPSAPVMALLALLPILGVVSSYFARLSIGTRHQAICQWLFLGLLALVGLETLAAALCGAGTVPLFGISLALMILAAVCEFDRERASSGA